MKTRRSNHDLLVFSLFLLCSQIARAEAPKSAKLELGAVETRANYDLLDVDPGAGRLDSSGNTPAYIGSSGGRDEFFAGGLDDVRVYRMALTAEQIQGLAEAKSDVANEDLTGWWKLDGTLANSAPKIVDPPREAIAAGDPPKYVEGRTGQALQLNGSNQTARVDHYNGLKPTTGQITIAAWIRPTATPDKWVEIYRKEDGNARQLLGIGKTGFYGLWVGLGIGGSYVEHGAPLDRDKLKDGKWHHVAATFDGKKIDFYYDGRSLRKANLGSDPLEVASAPEDKRLRVAFLGNTFIERAATHGYIETELTRRMPDRDIVFRNLGWPGDNINGDARVEFGPGEERRRSWQRPGSDLGDYGLLKMLGQIKRARPDVLLIGYGSNVAFQGEPGLDKFKQGLDRLLDTLEPTGVRVVLLSPPPREPHGAATNQLKGQNKWLRQVAEHVQHVAAKRGLAYVDVFHGLKPPAGDPSDDVLTDNGIHLNGRGYQALARLVAGQLVPPEPTWQLHLRSDASLVKASGTSLKGALATNYGLRFTLQDERLPAALPDRPSHRVLRIDGLAAGRYALDIDGRRVARGSQKQWADGIRFDDAPEFEHAERLRQAIVEKNRLFFYGFRPQNKTYIYLFRKHERGHHAGEVAQFARLVAQEEGEIARLRRPVARQYEVVRETDYPEHEVPRDVPEPNVEQELKSFTIAEGFEVNLFASNPMIANPINVNWDERGRMWVATSTIYPHLQPGQKPNDKIIVLEDIDRDGRADKSTVFADGLLIPHSVIPGDGGAYVTQSTDVLFLKDTNGDGRADERRVLFTGFGNADVHHMIHGLRWGPGGDLYFNQSIYINSIVETPWGVRTLNASGIWRLRPDTLRLEVFSRGLVNPWGHAFDRWGQSFATDGAGGGGIAYMFPGSAYGTAHGAARTLRSLNPGRPKECGLEVLSGRHLPEQWRGRLVTGDFRASRVTAYELSENGSGYQSKFLGSILASSHRSFRPVDSKVGPDGAIYVVDWYNPIIDHGEVDFHHPLRDKHHGRIWRMTAKGRPPVEPPELATAAVPQLLEALTLPELWTRDQARRLLRERGAQQVLPALKEWTAALDPSAEQGDRHLLEALRVYQGLRVPQPELLKQVLASPDHHVRAAGVRVLADWQDRVPQAIELLAAAIDDEHPQVRLEAVNAARQIGSRQAAAVALRALDRPRDPYLDYAAWLAVRETSSQWLPALRSGEVVFDGDPTRVAFALAAVGDQAGLRPLVELIEQKKLGPGQRVDALKLIAALGDANDRELVVREALTLEPNELNDLLRSLDQPASANRPIPPNAARIVQLLDSKNAQTQALAAALVGRWKVAGGRDKLIALAGDPRVDENARFAAAEALIALDRGDGIKHLQSLAAAKNPPAVRATAIAAWSTVDPQNAARHAADALAVTKDVHDATRIFDALITHRDGPASLAGALDGRRLPGFVAAEGVRLAGQSGRNLSALTDALITAGQLEPLSQRPDPEEFAALQRDVAEHGDPQRGQRIFRHRKLNCTSCHAIGGAGGKVGPDLSSLGGSAQLDYLLESIVDPSAKIKQGFGTHTIYTADGKVRTGRIERRTEKQVFLRDAEDRLLIIPAADVEEAAPSPLSLMPNQLSGTLRRDELLDLVSFLSVLGKQDGFRVPAENFVRHWEVLEANEKLAEQLARSAELPTLATLVESPGSSSWRRGYSTASGFMPLEDIPRLELANNRAIGFVRFRIEREKPGKVRLLLNDSKGLSLWHAGKKVNVKEQIEFPLDAGVHEITLQVNLAQRKEPLAVEVK